MFYIALLLIGQFLYVLYKFSKDDNYLDARVDGGTVRIASFLGFVFGILTMMIYFADKLGIIEM